MRLGRKLMIAGAVIFALGVTLTAIGKAAGPHYTPADTSYLNVARQVMVGKTDSSRIDAGHTICDSLASGISPSIIIAAEATNGIDSLDAQLLIGAAINSYCPEQ